MTDDTNTNEDVNNGAANSLSAYTPNLVGGNVDTDGGDFVVRNKNTVGDIINSSGVVISDKAEVTINIFRGYRDDHPSSWLETPSKSRVNPPIKTRVQDLPFHELSWEDFERLCLRLVRTDATVEYCQLYGERGQDQSGIDIYAWQKLSNTYHVYQCKRVKSFSSTNIRSAVARFLDSEWLKKAKTFVLCTTHSLIAKKSADEIEIQRAILYSHGVDFIIWDRHQLCIKLKQHPQIIDDFFGRAWVEAFCGLEQADQMGKRLDSQKIIEFRNRIADFYRRVFNTHDPGLPIISNFGASSLPLQERYVVPDIYDKRRLMPGSLSIIEPVLSQPELNMMMFADLEHDHQQSTSPTPRALKTYHQRQSIEDWLSTARWHVILGGPGSGKSSLLRFIALDLLTDTPRMTKLAQKWGKFLPIWIPFAFWTKMIGGSATATCSLREVLFEWLRSWDETRLWHLIEQALDDERLLLLVDGLDEWTNESAGRLAIERLQVFVERRQIPTIVTARPHGLSQIGFQSSMWHMGELSDFSLTQQTQLSYLWFITWIKSCTTDASLDTKKLEREATFGTQEFLAELQKSSDLRELAKVPLLLCLLIFLRLHNTRLPQNRFKAYALLTEHLISIHPQRRMSSASLMATQSDLSDEDIKKMLAYLAYQIQIHFGGGIIDLIEAQRFVEHFFTDVNYGYGFEQREARQFSRKMLTIGANTLGLLVRVSPKEIKFFHRSLQEYLAAYHLSQQPLQEQLTTVEDYCADPQWYDVILGLFALTSRAEDIDAFVQRIKAKPAKIIERYVIERLLCETAFGDFNCPLSLIRQLVHEAFEQIEMSSSLPHREQLLNLVLEGMRMPKLKELIKTMLSRWFPCRIRWRASVYEAMTSWALSVEVTECIWKGLHDEETDNQRAAAKALAKLGNSDKQIGDRLADLAHSAVDTKVQAAAILSLLEGWSNHQAIDNILNNAIGTVSPELQLVSISGFVQRDQQTEEHREILVKLAERNSGLDYRWKDDLPSLLIRGWRCHNKTKEIFLRAAKQKMQNSDEPGFDRDIVLRILIEGYPQDEDVAQFCIEQLKYEKYPHIFNYPSRFSISQNFKDHPGLVAAIDEWLPRQDVYQNAEITLAALVGRTEVAKKILLSTFETQQKRCGGIQWQALALLENWGMQDAEVEKAIMEAAYGPTQRASWIAHLLPRIIKDKTACRLRLLTLLQDPQCTWYNFILAGLQELNAGQPDQELVDILLSLKVDRENMMHMDVYATLIAEYTYDKRVRQLALQELALSDGMYSAVAWGWGKDEEIRSKLCKIANPLPAALRQIIATHLGQVTGDEAFAISLLEQYDADPDTQVKTQASISYHKRLRAGDHDTAAALEALKKNIICYGLAHDERRQAAFAGLIVLNRLDIMRDARETIGKDRHCTIKIADSLYPNVPVIRLLLEHWSEIESVLGPKFLEHLSIVDADQISLWDTLCMFADEYPIARAAALRYLEKGPQRIEANMLRFLERTQPNSALLLNYCLQAVKIDLAFRGSDTAVVAAEILGSQFGGDSAILAQLVNKDEPEHIYEAQIIALCEGWADSHELDAIFKHIRESERPLSYATYFQLLSRKSSTDKIIEVIADLLNSPIRTVQHRMGTFIRPILRRIREDDELFDNMLKCLGPMSSPSEKLTLPKLISAARGTSSDLQLWCMNEIERQLSTLQFPEVGFDLMTGDIQPVVYGLVQMLTQTDVSAMNYITNN